MAAARIDPATATAAEGGQCRVPREEEAEMPVQKLHHVVYRCNDAKQTAAFYTGVLELEYAMAVSASTS